MIFLFMIVLGEVVIGADCPEFQDAVVFVYLEDVSLADAPARRIATAKLTSVQHSSGHEGHVPFELTAELSDPRASYILRAHVSPHGSADVQVGDCVTMEHTPAGPGQPGEGIKVRVRPVG